MPGVEPAPAFPGSCSQDIRGHLRSHSSGLNDQVSSRTAFIAAPSSAFRSGQDLNGRDLADGGNCSTRSASGSPGGRGV
jgi:hypothetical protein